MTVRTYTIAGRIFSKVSDPGDRINRVHIVEDGQFWKGAKSWQHKAVCGESITGPPVQWMKVTCVSCRAFIRELAEGENAAARRAEGER